MRRIVRCLALLTLAGLVSVACGARLPAAERNQAAYAILHGGGGTEAGGTGSLGGSTGGGTTTGGTGGGTTTGGGTSGGGSTTGSGGGTSGGGSTSGGTGGGSTGSGSTTGSKGGGSTTGSGGGSSGGSKSTSGGSGGSKSTTGGATSSSCPTSASGPGISGKTINIGTIADETGPVNGLFDGAVQGEEAFVNYINSQGGVCGFTLHDESADDGTNCTQNQQATSSLGAKTFALVGTFSLYDGCGASYISQNSVPDLHVSLDASAAAPKSHFDMEPNGNGYATGMFKYYDGVLGSKVKSVGTIVEGIPSAEAKTDQIVKSAESQGWHFVYNQTTSPTSSDWTSNFVTMCQSDHIQVFFESSENANYAAKMVSDEQAAGCKGVVNIIPIAYDQAFLPDLSSDGGSSLASSVEGYNEYSLFFNSTDAQNIPMVGTLQTWFSRTNGSAPLNLYAMFAWSEGLLLVDGIEHAGKTLTRASLIAALDKVKNYDADGLMAPVTPSSKTEGASCYIIWKVEGKGFARVDDPSNNFRCDGSYLK